MNIDAKTYLQINFDLKHIIQDLGKVRAPIWKRKMYCMSSSSDFNC